MNIEIKKDSQTSIISISGRLDTTTAPLLEKTINEQLNDVNNIILNFEGLAYISSAGLRVLLTAQKKIQGTGSMILKNVCEEVMEVFEITGFADILVIE